MLSDSVNSIVEACRKILDLFGAEILEKCSLQWCEKDIICQSSRNIKIYAFPDMKDGYQHEGERRSYNTAARGQEERRVKRQSSITHIHVNE
ncbi:hypothetical protein GDO81_023098 [Engystomops pustulosus]|uniref:Uncharacterized protein n=1 Tax=Engystomops pustulosus TaxID=76066 RepID=A0AAV6Z9Q6_ENGPU|nr:hypothetical protein GDO81_023098 [Engystomops pustulosus]